MTFKQVHFITVLTNNDNVVTAQTKVQGVIDIYKPLEVGDPITIDIVKANSCSRSPMLVPHESNIRVSGSLLDIGTLTVNEK